MTDSGLTEVTTEYTDHKLTTTDHNLQAVPDVVRVRLTDRFRVRVLGIGL